MRRALSRAVTRSAKRSCRLILNEAPRRKLRAAQEAENSADLNRAHQLLDQTISHAADRVEVSPPDAVSRCSASWRGMAVEIVQANRRCRVDYRYHAPAPMLVYHERGVHHDGCTAIEGLPKSTLQDCSRKFVFVPSGHGYHDWHEPRTLTRAIFFYFDPSQLPTRPDLEVWRWSPAPQLFVEDVALTETALKLTTLIESGGPDHRLYLEALGVVLAHELLRINTGRHGAQAPTIGGLAAWQRRKAIAYIEEHLAEPISLEVLAGLGRPCPPHFFPPFPPSFRMPPPPHPPNQRIRPAKNIITQHAAP